MKYILLTAIIFFINVTAFASDTNVSLCSKDQNDILLNKTIDKKYKCQFQWKNQKTIHSIEILVLKNYCKRYEGGVKIDCIVARTCSNKTPQNVSYGPYLLNSLGILKYLCVDGKYELYGLSHQKGTKVFVNCKNKRPKDITVINPAGKKHNCPLPSFLKYDPSQIKDSDIII